MKYKNFEILKEIKQITHTYDKREVFKIKTNEWFKCVEFLSLNNLYKFIDKEVEK